MWKRTDHVAKYKPELRILQYEVMPFHNDILLNLFFPIYFLDIEQNIEKEEHSNKTSADLRIRKTQVSNDLSPVIPVSRFGFIWVFNLIWLWWMGFFLITTYNDVDWSADTTHIWHTLSNLRHQWRRNLLSTFIEILGLMSILGALCWVLFWIKILLFSVFYWIHVNYC